VPEGGGEPSAEFVADEALTERIPLRRAVLIAAVACLLVGLLEAAYDLAMSGLAGRERTVFQALRANVPWFLLWIAFMPAVLWLAQRFRFDNPRWPRSAVAHVTLGLLISLAHGVAFGILFHYVTGVVLQPTVAEQIRLFLSRYLFMDLMTYAAAIGAYWSVEYFRHFRASSLAAAQADARAARLEARLAEARLQALRMELKPHFLFNALNAVAGLVRRREHDAAIEMLVRLGDLLRTTLSRGMPAEVTLSEEIGLLRQFLDIELVRFGDRLRVVWDIADECTDAGVPPLILQPLVENALRHGIARRSGAGLMCIAANRVGLQLELTVRDTGEGLRDTGDAPLREGIGLRNTRQRLEELYGLEAAMLTLTNAAGGGACARVLLPFHRARNPRDVAMGA
jgi:sensor histidine kinase YesM